MSWPVTSFYCTKCDFCSGDVLAWGPKEYVLDNGLRLPVQSTLGICLDCNGVRAIESLSEDQFKANLATAIKERREHSAQLVRPWWQLHRFMFYRGWQKDVRNWKDEYRRLTMAIEDSRDLLKLLAARQSPPRCLGCGSHHVQAPLYRFKGDQGERPKYTGTIHSDCGGEICVKDASGLRISLVHMVSRFTPEGILIEKIRAD